MSRERTKETIAFTRSGAWVSGWLFILLLIAALPVKGGLYSYSGDAKTDFETANKLYEEGRFVDAVAAYGKLIDSGAVSAAIFFNRGNACFRTGQTGRAIVDYLHAEKLAPRDKDVRTNLQVARTRARGGVAYSEPRLQKLLAVLTINEWALLAAAGVWGFFMVLATIQWRMDLKPALQKYAVVSAMVAVAAGVALAVKLNVEYFADTAVVVAGEAEVRNGPLDEAIELFKVRDGAELEVLDHKDGWLQVADAAQRTGWVKAGQVVEVKSGK